MGRLRCPRPKAYVGHGRAGKVLLGFLRGAACYVTDPESRLEAATLIEAVHARVFSAALHQDVVTVPGPRCRKRGADNGASVTHPSKFGMRDHILEKAVPPSASQEIWRRDQHAGCNDLCVHGGYEHRNAVVGQHFQPNLLRSRYRLSAGAYLCDAEEREQRGKVGSLSEPGIGHLEYRIVNQTSLWPVARSRQQRPQGTTSEPSSPRIRRVLRRR